MIDYHTLGGRLAVAACPIPYRSWLKLLALVLVTCFTGIAGSESLAQSTEEVRVQGIVTGQVRNGTALGTVPADLTISLLIDDGAAVETRETTANPDGGFQFDDVPIQANYTYVAVAVYRDRRFFSEIHQGSPETASVNLPLTIYELTEDPSVISINRVVTRITPVELQNIGSGLEILQFFVYSNHSDRLYTTNQQVGEQTYASLTIPLPPGAVILSVDSPERYTLLHDQFAIVDNLAVTPGDNHPVQIVYFLPYDDGAIIEQPVSHTFNGEMRLLVWPNTLEVITDQLMFTGEQAGEERVYKAYDGTLSLEPGAVIRYELSGRAAAANTSAGAQNNLLPLVVVMVGLALLLVVVLLYRRRGGPPRSKQQMIDALVQQIAILDSRHDAGVINHDLYHQKRKALKARLDMLIDEGSESA